LLIPKQLVEKLQCILSLSNLFPSLARRFGCCQSCSVSAPFGLTALTALRSVLLKNRRLVKVNLEVSSQLQFDWPVCRAYGTGRHASVKDCKVCPLKRGWQISLIMPSNGLGLLFFKNNPVCFRQACG